MEVIVGKTGKQPFKIDDDRVSHSHVRLSSRPDGTLLLEDLTSTNGTFVEGNQIKKKVVLPNTIIRLGPEFCFRAKDAFPKDFDPDTIMAFGELETVYKDYMNKRTALGKKNSSIMALRVLLFGIMGVVGIIASLMPQWGLVLRLGVSIPILIVCVILIIKGFKIMRSLPEKMVELDDQFKIDYVCPHCKTFLGAIPFEGLKRKGKCPYCKQIWIEE